MNEYINKEKLLEVRPFTVCAGRINDYDEGFLDCAEEARDAVKDFPAADVVPVKHGKWIYWPGWVGNHDKRIDDATCSICGFKHPTVLNVKTPKDCLYKYCPECGAKMDLED